MSELSFQRVTTGIIDVADTMKGQVVRYGSLEAAIRNGHGPALRQQLANILTMCNSLDRMIQNNVPNGSYSVSSGSQRPESLARTE